MITKLFVFSIYMYNNSVCEQVVCELTECLLPVCLINIPKLPASKHTSPRAINLALSCVLWTVSLWKRHSHTFTDRWYRRWSVPDLFYPISQYPTHQPIKTQLGLTQRPSRENKQAEFANNPGKLHSPFVFLLSIEQLYPCLNLYIVKYTLTLKDPSVSFPSWFFLPLWGH